MEPQAKARLGQVIGIPSWLVKRFLRHKWLLIGGALTAFVILMFGIQLKNALVIVLLTLAASFSTYYKKYIKFTVGFELVTLATVLTAIAYGPFIGAIVGFVSSLAAEVIPQMIDPSSFFWIISVVVSAFAAAFLHSIGLPLFWIGMGALAVQLIISEPPRLFSGDQYLQSMAAVNIVTTLGWTVLWFRLLAEPLLTVMTG